MIDSRTNATQKYSYAIIAHAPKQNITITEPVTVNTRAMTFLWASLQEKKKHFWSKTTHNK